MKPTAIKNTAINLLSIYTSPTGDISFGSSVKGESPGKKARIIRERINGRKFSWH